MEIVELFQQKRKKNTYIVIVMHWPLTENDDHGGFHFVPHFLPHFVLKRTKFIIIQFFFYGKNYPSTYNVIEIQMPNESDVRVDCDFLHCVNGI